MDRRAASTLPERRAAGCSRGTSTRCRRIRPIRPVQLHGDHHDGLVSFAATSPFPCCRDRSRRPQPRRGAISPGAHHRPAQLVQPRPGGLVAAKPEHPLDVRGADAVLLAGNEPHGHEPGPQRLARVLEDRARFDRDLLAATAAEPEPAAPWAARALRAAHAGQNNPSGQRNCSRYNPQASSVAKRRSHSKSVLG